MKASPGGRLAKAMVHLPVSCELAYAADTTLESTEREVAQVREILRLAIDGLVAEFGEAARREGVVALQFQDVCDQLLASVGRRLGMLRSVLGMEVAAPARDESNLFRGSTEMFQESP
jgi:hypothetical protein